MSEVQTRLAGLRAMLTAEGLAATRLRGVDSFAWATGGDGAVLLTDEAGVTEVLVTATDAFVLTDTHDALDAGNALAWTPSLPGAKVEDTVLCTDAGLDVLTTDPAWPHSPNADGIDRPDLLARL